MADNSRLIVCTNPNNRRLLEHLIHSNFSVEFEQEIIWHYDFGTYTKKRFVPSHDNILIYKFGSPPFNWQSVAIESQRQQANDSRADHRGRTPGTVWNIPRVPGNSLSRTYCKDLYKVSQQPEELVKRIVLAYTNENDIVFDPFSHSGTVGLICKRHHRRFYGVTNKLDYAKAARERIEKQDWMKVMKAL